MLKLLLNKNIYNQSIRSISLNSNLLYNNILKRNHQKLSFNTFQKISSNNLIQNKINFHQYNYFNTNNNDDKGYENEVETSDSNDIDNEEFLAWGKKNIQNLKKKKKKKNLIDELKNDNNIHFIPSTTSEKKREEGIANTKEFKLPIIEKQFIEINHILKYLDNYSPDIHSVTQQDVSGYIADTFYMIYAICNDSYIAQVCAEGIQENLQARDLYDISPSATGIEGLNENNNEWLIIDTGPIVIHIMNTEKYKELDLFNHWEEVKASSDEIHDNKKEDYLDNEYIKHPPPDSNEYNTSSEYNTSLDDNKNK